MVSNRQPNRTQGHPFVKVMRKGVGTEADAGQLGV